MSMKCSWGLSRPSVCVEEEMQLERKVAIFDRDQYAETAMLVSRQ